MGLSVNVHYLSNSESQAEYAWKINNLINPILLDQFQKKILNKSGKLKKTEMIVLSAAFQGSGFIAVIPWTVKKK